MYLTAHKVRNPSAEGINAFLHVHKDVPLPYRSPAVPDIDRVSQFAGGYEVAKDVDVRPGGNDVLAYLDLVAPDDVGDAALRAAVDSLSRRVSEGDPIPVTVIGDGVAARFGGTIDVAERAGEPSRVLRELTERCLRLLPHRFDPVPEPTGPYAIWVAAGAEGARLWLPPATLSRLPQSPSRRLRILIPHDVLAGGPPFDALRESALALLGLGEADVRSAGGVEFVDPRTARVLWRRE